MRPTVVACSWFLLALQCSRETPPWGDDTSPGADGGNGSVAGADGSASSGSGGAPTLTTPTPRYHPPPGFESCVHAEVKADCTDGWCSLPPSCFVMGSPEDEWYRSQRGEERVAITLTRTTELQQREFSREQWETVTGTLAPGPNDCTEPKCPVAMVSWWDAVHVANLLSEQKSLAPCYEPVGCTGALGVDLECTGVADPDASVYECEGYRLPTRAEAEYAARAGTISTFYSGDITVYAESSGLDCNVDPALELIAWYCFNSGGHPHEGGQLLPNDFGLHDLLGNLAEWLTTEQFSSSSPAGDDPRGAVGSRPERVKYTPRYDGPNHFLRPAGSLAGSWASRGASIGFRLIRTLPD